LLRLFGFYKGCIRKRKNISLSPEALDPSTPPRGFVKDVEEGKIIVSFFPPEAPRGTNGVKRKHDLSFPNISFAKPFWRSRRIKNLLGGVKM
jgi:hypothetical protein